MRPPRGIAWTAFTATLSTAWRTRRASIATGGSVRIELPGELDPRRRAARAPPTTASSTTRSSGSGRSSGVEGRAKSSRSPTIRFSRSASSSTMSKSIFASPVGRTSRAQRAERVEDDAERVAHLVRDDRGQLAERGEPLALDELLLGARELGVARAQVLVEPRVLGGDRELVRDGGRALDLRGREEPRARGSRR